MMWLIIKIEAMSQEIVLFLITQWILVSGMPSGSKRNDSCTSETFKAKCYGNDLIVMDAALYGRMRIGRCVKQDMGFLGCQTNVLDIADKTCSGKSECEIRVPNGEMDKAMTCYAELSRYLEASYSCVKSKSIVNECTGSLDISVTSHSMHIPSNIATLSQCQTHNLPWILEASPGQTINLTLTDFNWKNDQRADSSVLTNQNSNVFKKDCPVHYGYLMDLDSKQERIDVCGGFEGIQAREYSLYTSRSHSIRVVVAAEYTEHVHFLLKYEAIGCPDLVTPQHSWTERKGEELIVGCQATRQTWHLKCKGNNWVGVIGNCTQYLPNTPAASSVTERKNIFHSGLAIVIIIGVAAVISCTIITVGVICYKSSKVPRCNRNQHVQYQCSTYNAKDGQLYNIGDGMEMYKSANPGSIYNFGKNEYTHIWDHQQFNNNIDTGEDLISQAITYPVFDAPLLPIPSPAHQKIPASPAHKNTVSPHHYKPSLHHVGSDTYRASMSEPSTGATALSKYFVLDK